MGQTLSTSIAHLLHRAAQLATDRFSRELDDADLTLRQLVVLSAIDANEGASQTAIVAATGIDRSTLADIVRRLVKRGLLARRRTKADARAYAVTLTSEGRRVLERGAPAMARVEADLLSALPVKRRSELVALIGSIVEGGALPAR